MALPASDEPTSPLQRPALEGARLARASAAGVLTSSMFRYVLRRIAWGVFLLLGDTRADCTDPPPTRARQAAVHAVLDLPEGPRAPLRPRLLVPERRLGQI